MDFYQAWVFYKHLAGILLHFLPPLPQDPLSPVSVPLFPSAYQSTWLGATVPQYTPLTVDTCKDSISK